MRLLLLLPMLLVLVAAKNWKLGCTFQGSSSLKNVRSRGADCGEKCYQTPECDHFVWTPHDFGTCFMKKNYNPFVVREVDASEESVCGIIRSKVTYGLNENQ